MFTKERAIDFAEVSAIMAIDKVSEYGCLADAVASYRENIRDTLKDERCPEFEGECFVAFDAKVAELTAELFTAQKHRQVC